MLPASRIYSFLDNKKGFTIHFLEGQKVIHDLVLMHHFEKEGFSFFRDCVLSSLQLVNYLKPGENAGFYIDSQEPFYSFKIELNNQGTFRTLILPKGFSENPSSITGQVKLTKISVNAKTPYSSIIEVDDVKPVDMFNQFMKSSYQTNCELLLSNTSDQSILVTKLPPEKVDREIMDDISMNEFLKDFKIDVAHFFSAGHTDIEKIVKHFEAQGFSYLQSKETQFNCPCSKDQFVIHMSRLPQEDLDEVFQSGDAHINCDYCNKDYFITRKDLTKFN